jgi:ABC-type hemin transport system substrate-binding protein
MPTYEFYVSTYMGNQIAEHDFPRLITRAGVYVENLCVTADESKLNMAICAVAEAWQTNEQGGELASQSVGGWSKSYQQAKPKTNEQRLLDAVKMYLGNGTTVRWC